ncbi:MAG: hypothetical protein Q4D88_05925 [Anaerococcus sp.]|nr:hypothetical protein [Anaerococcus sp.]
MDLIDYKKLANLPGVSSFEGRVSSYIKNELEKRPDNVISKDMLSSLIVKREGLKENVKLMVASHIDEVGFIVEDIVGDFLKLKNIGSVWPHLVVGQIYKLINQQGKSFRGIISSPASHGLSKKERSKTLGLDQIYLDLGLSKEDFKNLNINIGDQVLPESFDIKESNPEILISKAADNRISAYIGMEVMSNYLDNKSDIYWAFTSQEEPGLRGARTTSSLIKPDLAISIDTTLAGDIPFDKNSVSLGSGVCLSFIDSNSISHRGFMNYIIDLCKENNISHQFAVFNKGGTDMGNIHKSADGVIGMSLSIPVRYMHSSFTMANTRDVDECIKLIKLICEKICKKDFERIINQ